jgi:ectoine hydroxylase-related dioxygenase (phytanoyl-CoA dioxygenase family)
VSATDLIASIDEGHALPSNWYTDATIFQRETEQIVRRSWHFVTHTGELANVGDQFLAKPPKEGARTPWHQDEGYWGRNLDERGITCWMPFHDVDPSNGCMHFIDGGHLDGVLEHRSPSEIASDLLQCEPDETRAVAAPLALGGVTFHHSKTPHKTTPNVTDRRRRILTQHLRMVGAGDEGDHYPWKVYVNQVTGEVTIPESR